MKYEVSLTKTDRRVHPLHADSPDEAFKIAKAFNRGFAVQTIVQVDDDGEAVAEWELLAVCEGCEKPIFTQDDYHSDSEGVPLCGDCLKGLIDKQP